MSGLVVVELDQRSVLRIGGAERASFLQNLISGDVGRVERGLAIWSALLTPQGKYLADFFLYPDGETFLLDVETGAAADLMRRLMLYRLRAKVTIEDISDECRVFALLGDEAPGAAGLPAQAGASTPALDGVAAVDPRLAALGVRLLAPKAPELAGAAAGSLADWDRLRLLHGVPDGSRDLVAEKTTLLEAGFDELGGVDFAKGCYVGQELTARMKYRGLLKKRLFPVEIAGEAPDPGTPLRAGDSEVGEMRSSAGDLGLALVRLDAADQVLQAGDTRLTVRRPAWLPPG
ncbi:CAF17-like 4Fe-4S cluster assembly/insertion protein YgfZ [Geminicoccus roseus]|uniref:CAF17-like 4Fe-4S cluster assembly/insertion protein YgfZ n=1 Tax=Geminicoccus roseus TaxID=404900 RepID=UPI0004812B31|nr:folate-binding protein YgfZ [Geminicoccus roseus]